MSLLSRILKLIDDKSQTTVATQVAINVQSAGSAVIPSSPSGQGIISNVTQSGTTFTYTVGFDDGSTFDCTAYSDRLLGINSTVLVANGTIIG